MKRLLTLVALIATLGLPPAAQAWEREAFKALKGIKDMATEQAKQEKAEKEQAERDEQERVAREQAAKEQAERDRLERERQEQEQAAREQAAKEQARAAKEEAARARAAKEEAERDEQERQQAERQKWEQERRKWEQERRQWEQERQQAEQAQADSDPQADPAPAEQAQADSDPQVDPAPAEQAQADSDPQADPDKAERERAERERVEQAGGMSCYGVALLEEAGVIVFSEQEQLKKLKAHIADLKKNCYGDPNEPPAAFQEQNPSLGPRHCHKPMLAMGLQEDLRDKAAEAKMEKKRQAAEKKFDALFYEAAEAGCVEKEALDAFHAEKAERARAARDKAWCEQNGDRRTSDMNCFEMEKAYDCREAAWIAAVERRGEANTKMRKARQTADAADPESMAAFDRVQAERAAAIRQADLARKPAQDVLYDGVKNNCPTQAWGFHPGLVDQHLEDRLQRLQLMNRMKR